MLRFGSGTQSALLRAEENDVTKAWSWVCWVTTLFATLAVGCGAEDESDDDNANGDVTSGGATMTGGAAGTLTEFATTSGGSVRHGETELPRFDRRPPKPAAVPSVRVEERAP